MKRTVMNNDLALATENAREWMINHQVRPWLVDDERVLAALGRVPREDFVPAPYRELAFAEVGLPLPCGETMLKPVIEGRLLQELQPQPGQTALLIGTGSGYVAACLTQLIDHLVALDIHAELTASALARFERQRIRNAELLTVDYTTYVPDRSFDRILVTGSMPLFDPRLPDWLTDGGLLLLITGMAPAMQVQAVRRTGNSYSRQRLFETEVHPLRNVLQPPEFYF